MTAAEELALANRRAAAARFFLRSGRAKGLTCGDGYSEPLFPLTLILEAEGLLSTPDSAYLAKCDAAIREAAREWAA